MYTYYTRPVYITQLHIMLHITKNITPDLQWVS